jgi:hypothetical protein
MIPRNTSPIFIQIHLMRIGKGKTRMKDKLILMEVECFRLVEIIIYKNIWAFHNNYSNPIGNASKVTGLIFASVTVLGN